MLVEDCSFVSHAHVASLEGLIHSGRLMLTENLEPVQYFGRSLDIPKDLFHVSGNSEGNGRLGLDPLTEAQTYRQCHVDAST